MGTDISYPSSLYEVSQQYCLGLSLNHGLNKTNSETLVNERYKGKIVSPNVANLCRRNLTSNEISFFSKRLRFVSTPRGINKAPMKKTGSLW